MTTKRALQKLLAGTCSPQGFVTTSLIATADATETRLPRIHTNQQFLEDIAISNSRSRSKMRSRCSAWCSTACPIA